MAWSDFGAAKYQEQGGITVSRRTLLPTVRWGAVFAGVVVGVSIQLVLSLLGLASGMSTLDMQKGETSFGPLAWAGLSMLIAAFIGGYVAARMTGLKRKADGVLHGVVAWAVTTLLFASLATSGGGLLGSVFHGVTPTLERAETLQRAPYAEQAPAGGLLGLLKNQLGSNIQPEMLEKLRQLIVAGQRDEAVHYMVTALGVEPVRAQTVADQALIVSGSAEPPSASGQGRADQARQAGKSAVWTVFLAVALSLLMGIVGGVLGALGARRTTWMEEAVSTSTPPHSP